MPNHSPAKPFAVIVPVGPAKADAWRLKDLIDSLLVYEDTVSQIVIVDDSARGRALNVRTHGLCAVTCLVNPRGSLGQAKLGGQCASMLHALRAVRNCSEIAFVLKLDTDALIIGPFAEALRTVFHQSPGVGLLGSIGRTCNSHSYDFHGENYQISDLLLKTNINRMPINIRERIITSVTYGFGRNIYCQGGGYAVSSEMLFRLSAHGCLSDADSWIDVPVAEDVMMAMYAHAVGLRIADLSGEGQPFGVQWKGLPFGPEALVSRGHAIIHSLKNDVSRSEKSVRNYFSAFRKQELVRHHLHARPINTNKSAWLYADPVTVELLSNSQVEKVCLMGSFSGKFTFGAVVQVKGLITGYQRRRPIDVCVLAKLPDFATPATLTMARRYCSPAKIVLLSAREIGSDTCRSFGVELVRDCRNVVATHQYGSAMFHPTMDVSRAYFAEAIRALSARHCFLSGIHIAENTIQRFVEYVQQVNPDLIGCRDRDTLHLLERSGITAFLSSTDSLDALLSVKSLLFNSAPSTYDDTNDQFALHLGFRSYGFAPQGSVRADLIRSARALTHDILVQLKKRYGGERGPVLINAAIDTRDDLHDTWSTLASSEFGRFFCTATCVDALALALADDLLQLSVLMKRESIVRFFATSYELAFYSQFIGIPSLLIAPNSYYQEKARSLGQNSEFKRILSFRDESLLFQQKSFVQNEIATREEWWSVLMNLL